MPRRCTRTLSIDRDNPEESALAEAAEILRAGGLVAFATETVYGLGADATNPAAVAGIFEAKGRPSTNPLIVHVASVQGARECVSEWPTAAQTLADAFWPGPLTMVLPRSSIIPDLVTAGLDTVGVRVPLPAATRRLILRADRPIAAPSANRSTGISPTNASHVLKDLDGRIDLLLDSGHTSLGLESTVIDLTTRDPRLLRPGPITRAELERVLSAHVREPAEIPEGVAHTSPGQMAIHYAPRTRAIRVETARDLNAFEWPGAAALIVVGEHELPGLPPRVVRFDLNEPDDAAQHLYAVLHASDSLSMDLIVIIPPPDLPEWAAIRDRLRRATSLWPG